MAGLGHPDRDNQIAWLCLCLSNERLYSRRNSQSQTCLWETSDALSGHTVKSYRADNGCFADKGFHNACTQRDQRLSFCGVGAHHQNGIVENRNKQLTLGARTLLLHGMRKWPQMIDTMFWPFAMKAQAERMNCLHLDRDGKSPESKLHGVKIEEHVQKE